MTHTSGGSETGPAGEATHERRLHHRRSVACLLLNFQPGDQQSFPPSIGVGRIVDVSKTGVQLETDRELEEGRILGLEVALEQRIVHATIRVVHTGRLESGLFGIGAEFTFIGEKDRAALCNTPPAS